MTLDLHQSDGEPSPSRVWSLPETFNTPLTGSCTWNYETANFQGLPPERVGLP